MSKYNVFVTTSHYEQVDANSAAEARNVAHLKWRKGEFQLGEYPEFFCEEADREPDDEL